MLLQSRDELSGAEDLPESGASQLEWLVLSDLDKARGLLVGALPVRSFEKLSEVRPRDFSEIDCYDVPFGIHRSSFFLAIDRILL